MTQSFFFRLAWGLVLGFVSLLCLFLLIDWDNSGEFNVQHRRVEIADSHINGYRNGHLSWRFYSDYMWLGNSKYLFYADKVELGQFFDSDGRVAVDRLKAKKLVINSKRKTVIANNSVSALVLDSNAPSSDVYDNAIRVYAEKFRYYDTSRAAYLSGDVSMTRGDARIEVPDTLILDTSANIATVEGGTRFTSSKHDISADRLVIDITDKRAHFIGNVKGKRSSDQVEDVVGKDAREQELRQEPTYFQCKSLTYQEADDGSIVIGLDGQVMIQQGDHHIQGDKGLFYDETGEFDIRGNVIFHTSSLEWLIDRERTGDFDNPNISKTASQTTTMNCNRLNFNSTLKTIRARGNVIVEQPQQHITAATLDFNDATQQLTLTGKVTMKRDGHDSIRADHIDIGLLDESINASGRVKSKLQF